MEIIQERLEREYDLDLITTAPTVVFEVISSKGETLYVDNPSKLPEPEFNQSRDAQDVASTAAAVATMGMSCSSATRLDRMVRAEE